jgi:ribonuclease P/MRP protein subunit POP3
MHVRPSQGKRSRKRKRTEEKAANQVTGAEPTSTPAKADVTVPAGPEIQHHITIGLNSTSRLLESLIDPLAPKNTTNPSNTVTIESRSQPRRLAAIFLTATTQDYLPYSYLPTLTALASSTQPNKPPIRLIKLSAASENKLCESLGIPRLGVVGVLEEAPGATPLIEYVRENVDAVDVAWAREVGAGRWLGSNILDGKEENGKGT